MSIANGQGNKKDVQETKGFGYYKRSSSAFKQKTHCPICGKLASRYADSFYCEDCDVNIDENGKLLDV